MQVLIVYHSDYGSTQKMAEAIAAGSRAARPDATIRMQKAIDTSLNDLTAADVLVFGTPVHMGSMAWPLKRLIDEAGKLWMENLLAGKIGGVFATGGGFGQGGGGVEQTLMALHSHFLEQGMIVIGMPKDLPGYADGGIQWGAYARTSNHEGMPCGISDKALVAARSYGAHLLEVATRLIG